MQFEVFLLTTFIIFLGEKVDFDIEQVSQEPGFVDQRCPDDLLEATQLPDLFIVISRNFLATSLVDCLDDFCYCDAH